VLRAPAAALAEHAEPVGVVHHQARAVAVLEFHDLGKRRQVALHREHAVDDDDLAFVGGGVLELLLQVVHVVVAILEVLAEAEAAAVDDAGVVQAVEERQVAAFEQAGQDAQVDLETGGEHEHGFALHELGQSLLELHVDVQGSVEQSRSGTAGAVVSQGLGCGLLDLRVVGQAEVVVRPEHHQRVALVEDRRILGRGQGAVIGIDAFGSHLDRASR
jgi:hypothetical protein